MKCGLEDLGRVPLLGQVPVHAAPEEDVPGEWGHDNSEMFFRQSEQRFQALNKLTNIPIRVQRDVTQEVELTPPPPPPEKGEPESRPHA